MISAMKRPKMTESFIFEELLDPDPICLDLTIKIKLKIKGRELPLSSLQQNNIEIFRGYFL